MADLRQVTTHLMMFFPSKALNRSIAFDLCDRQPLIELWNNDLKRYLKRPTTFDTAYVAAFEYRRHRLNRIALIGISTLLAPVFGLSLLK